MQILFMSALHRSYDTDCCQALALVWERLSVSKRDTVKYVTERFEMELNDVEVNLLAPEFHI
jgi:hypothetical protein